MIESFVDLTYRGLSLGRRIKLVQVRPTSGYLELATPMPVGTHLAIATEDGVTFGATVSRVHEQVAASAGIERVPGMVVVPAIAGEPAASWWQARIALPDEDKPAPRPPRDRPVTLRPRAQTEPGPPPDDAITDEIPTMPAELRARLAAAAGVVPARPAGGPDDRRTAAMHPVEQEALAQLTRSADGGSVVRSGEHAVIDDGRKTMLMMPVDLSSLGLDPGASAGADGDLGANEGANEGANDDSDDGEAGEVDDAGDGGGARGEGAAGDAGPGDKPPVSRFKKRRRRR